MTARQAPRPTACITIAAIACIALTIEAGATAAIRTATATAIASSSTGLSFQVAQQQCEMEAARKLAAEFTRPSLPPELRSHPFKDRLFSCLAKVPQRNRLRIEGLQFQTIREGLTIRCSASAPATSLQANEAPPTSLTEKFRESPEFLRKCLTSPVYYDFSLRISGFAQDASRELEGDETGDILLAILTNRPLPIIPALWWTDHRPTFTEGAEETPLAKTVELYGNAFRTWPDLEQTILLRWRNAGLSRLAATVAAHSSDYFPVLPGKALTGSIPLPQHNDLSLAPKGQQPALRLLSRLLDRVIRTGRPLPLASVPGSPIYKEAFSEFRSPDPDFSRVLELAVISLRDQPSSDAFNLAGRALELDPAYDENALAALCYYQALITDPDHPFAAKNLRNLRVKMRKRPTE
jgi:hypothetical protein